MEKTLLLVLALLLVMTGAVYAKGLEVKRKAGDYNVVVRFDKNPPAAGNNSMEIEIRDASGHSVTDAKVKIDYSMPAMPPMPAMNYKTDAVLTGAIYAAEMNLPMSGTWNVAVKITRGGKTSAMKFSVVCQ